ncbi:DUF5925 domain-containing protein [Streptomyces sp. NBC_01614]|uniref:DUF5925 domain-containing protein n=1 Tax=Streptomyces sp. NBC_01614 TaxID=2975897 RepID=UPI00386571DE
MPGCELRSRPDWVRLATPSAAPSAGTNRARNHTVIGPFSRWTARSERQQSLQAAAPRRVISGGDGIRQVILALALDPYIAGAQPCARSAEIHCVREHFGAPALDDPRVVRRFTSDLHDICLLGGDGWTCIYSRNLRPSASVQAEVTVTAETPQLAAEILADLITAHGQDSTEEFDSVPVGFWHLSSRGVPTRVFRPTRVPGWKDIRSNYANSAAARIDHLANLTPATLRGTIILMHGPPGTGKTTALRSLVHAWQNWCGFEYILDPEHFFGSPDYLLHVATPARPRDDRWSALILEDCDELLRSDAKRAMGQNLGRLLNLSDGILGQGGKTLLIMTTNEDVHRLHPAVVRPGRCLAQVEVGPLSQEEVSRWNGGVAANLGASATLAQLYAHASVATPLLDTPRRTGDFTGAYL